MAAGPYFVPLNPPGFPTEQTNYERTPVLCEFASNSITWTWAFSTGDYTPPNGDDWPAIRMLVDGVVASAFVQPATNSYVFTATVANGHHIVDFEGVPSEVKILQKGFLVNSTGSPLPLSQQKPWTSRLRFEDLEDRLGPGAVQVPYPGDPVYPPSFSFKPRTVETYTTRLAQSALWTRRIQSNVRQTMVRRFVKTLKGDVVIEADNRLFHPYPRNSRGVPRVTLRDGPRGKGSLGNLFTIRIAPDGSGCYWADHQGRIGFLRFSDGDVRTIAGWRLKEGQLKVSVALHTNTAYDASWEVVGDWALVSGTKSFNESWSIGVKADARAPGVYREFWVSDALDRRILYVNDFTAQSVADYLSPQHPPVGYTAPGAPTGQAQLVDFLTVAKLTAMGFTSPQIDKLLNEPFGVTVNPAGTKIYWTNFGAGTVCRCNMDGTSPEVVFETAVYPTNSQLGISVRRGTGSNSTTLRTNHHLDGAAGVWKGSGRVQAIDFMSDGNPVWSERYTFAVRKGNLADGSVSTIGLPSISGSGLDLEMIIAVDRDGTCGPVDDVFGAAHNSFTDFRYSAAGAFQGRPFFVSSSAADALSGPQSNSPAPSYAYGLGIGGGRIVFQGGSSGWQIYEITKKLVTDAAADPTKFQRGLKGYEFGANPPMALTHGPYGQGELGFPSIDVMGGWDDATLDAYALAKGIPATTVGDMGGVEDFRYFVRWLTQDIDYSTPPPPPPPGGGSLRAGRRKTKPRTRIRIKAPQVAGQGTVGGGLPLWRRGLAPFQWTEIPNTALTIAQKPEWFEHSLTHEPLELASSGTPGWPSPNTTAALNWPFQDFVGAALSAFCGASIDTRNSTLYGIAGGGHNDYYGNFTWKLKLSEDEPRMVEACPTSPGSAVDAGGGDGPYALNSRLYLDGRPSSAHSFFGNQFIEARNRALRFGTCSTSGSGAANFPAVTSFNPETGQYEPNLTFPDAPHPIRFDSSICKDPATENVYVWDDANLMRWNQATNTWTTITTSAPSLEGHTACVDTRRNRLLVCSGHRYEGSPPLQPPHTLDLATNVITARTFTGPAAAEFDTLDGNGTGLVFQQHPTDPSQDCFLARLPAAGPKLYRINAETFVMDFLTTTGGDNVPAVHFHSGSHRMGCYNRILSVPQYGGIVYVPRANANVWFLRTFADSGEALPPVTGSGTVTAPHLQVAGAGRVGGVALDLVINRRDLNLSDVLFFEKYHETSRYERHQNLQVLTLAANQLKFKRWNLTAGGTNAALQVGTYELLLDGVAIQSIVIGAGTITGTFTVNLAPISDGWHIWETRFVGGTQDSAPWAVFVNKAGGAAVSHSEIPVVAGSYDLTRGAPHVWAMLPNGAAPAPMPLTPRSCPVFSTADAKSTLYRTNVVPVRKGNINRPSRDGNGVTGTFNFQNYQWDNAVRKYPVNHLLDGERGIGTLMMPTHIMLDRHGGAYCLDPWRVVRVSQTGKVTTRAGYRSSTPPRYWGEQINGQGLELVGDWNGIPAERRGFHELWGGAFDLDSLVLDLDDPPQFNSVNGQLEQPHAVGPRLFVADSQNNRVCLLTFDRDDFNAVPVVTEFLTGLSDPWDCVWVSGVLYVSERQANRVVAYNATTGAFIRIVLEGISGLAHVQQQNRFVVRDATLDTIRAQPIILPEGLFYQDDWLYVGSLAMAQVRRVHLATGEVQVVCHSPVNANDGNANFVKVAVSDGSFGPRGTVFTTTWSNAEFGMPNAFLPNTGPVGTRWLFYSNTTLSSGRGGQWTALGYSSAVGVGQGRLYCGSSEEGLLMISKALAGDPSPNYAQYARGDSQWNTRGYRIVYGDNGYGYQGLDLPWGVDADIDYFLTWNGHTPPP